MADFRSSPLAAVVHRTRLADVIPFSGWTALDGLGVDIMRTPLVDHAERHRGAQYARLTYRDASTWAAEREYQLPTPAHLVAAHAAAALRLRPVTLPATREMGSLAWSIEHDRVVAGMLALAGYDGEGIVSGIGKHWVAGAPRGRSWLMGWHVDELGAYSPTRRGPGWVQPAPAAGSRGVHDDAHHDYATTTLLVRPSCRGVDLDVPMVREAMALVRRLFIGDAPVESAGAAVVRVALGYVGTREATGRNDGAEVKRFFDGCTRLVNWQERPTGWVSGWDWCAAFASLCVHVGLGLPVGATAPVGRRIAVRELVEDARRSGRLRGRDYEPRPGDLYIGARGGGDPMRGGTGHVRVYVERVSATEYRGVGGNEGNAVRDARHRFDDPTWRAWIATT